MSTSSLSEKDEKFNHATAETKEVDEAAQLSIEGEVDPAEALRVRYVNQDELLVCSSLTWLYIIGKRLTGISSL